ncbi:hypothetical protein V499_09222 [Pseudogymnoascus sp. VKM F-103]|nr:hypothetical protein V499_09222 [Pseudogymnoascus sp. VKM F-103]
MAKVSKEQNRKMRRAARSKPRVDQEPVKGKEGKEKRRESRKAADFVGVERAAMRDGGIHYARRKEGRGERISPPPARVQQYPSPSRPPYAPCILLSPINPDLPDIGRCAVVVRHWRIPSEIEPTAQSYPAVAALLLRPTTRRTARPTLEP